MNLIRKRASKAHLCIKKLSLALLLIFTQFQIVYANTAVGGWTLGDAVVHGATTTWNATKDVGGKIANGVASIKPTPAQVANGLKRAGLLGIGLTAVQELLDGVDYVMDPANNDIRKKHVNDASVYDGYSNFNSDFQLDPKVYYSNPDDSCESVSVNLVYKKIISNNLYSKDKKHIIFDCIVQSNTGPFSAHVVGTSISQDEIKLQAATAIIDLAEKKDAKAQAFVSAVAQDLLEHDEDVQKAVVAQADDSQKDSEDQPVSVPSTSGNSTNATPPPDDEDEQEIEKKSNDETAKKKIENLKNSGKFNEDLSNATTKIYDKHGGFLQAKKDFDSLGLKNIRTVQKPEGEMYLGQLENNVMVNVRSFSTLDGRSTLEIQIKKPIKIRYD